MIIYVLVHNTILTEDDIIYYQNSKYFYCEYLGLSKKNCLIRKKKKLSRFISIRYLKLKKLINRKVKFNPKQIIMRVGHLVSFVIVQY